MLQGLDKATYLLGSPQTIEEMLSAPALAPFNEGVVDFLNLVSKKLMSNLRSKKYPDVVTFAFWIRKSSTLRLKNIYSDDTRLRLGRGVAFHIAPSNVPVNFAYSMATGLLTGNANVVRVPSKDFPQIDIICEAISEGLIEKPQFSKYMCLLRYGHDRDINDCLSSIADLRIVWGGDSTIEEIRKSPLPPRAMEITFADRYSFAVIDSDKYLADENSVAVAQSFYNDTFLTDQNACTSPKLVIWIGKRKEEAQNRFWSELHKMVEKKYELQPIQSVNKLTKLCLIASTNIGPKLEEGPDNLIIRVKIPRITDYLMEYCDNSGYFYEFDCDDIMDLAPICNNKRCQTIGYYGDYSTLFPLLDSGVKGIDRIVPIGRTMDFDLIWDGYDLPAILTRTVKII